MTREALMAAVRARLRQVDAALAVLGDDVAVDALALFPVWRPGEDYALGYRVRHDGKLYKCVQAHTSQAQWSPDAVPALWTEIAKPGEIPEWKQPTGAQDAYRIGDKVRYNGAVWVNEVDYNVYAPGVYGWREVA